MNAIHRVLALAIALSAGGTAASAQDGDNGTDPTKLRRLVWSSYEHMDLGHDVTRGTFKLMYERPISKTTSLRLTVPALAFDAPRLNGDLGLGNISLRMTHLLDVNKSRGIVLQGEIFGDTADRWELGNDATVLEGTVIYARFLPGGAIFAPALAHAQSVGGDNHVSETTLDLYYVPRLPDPAWYMTVDPAIVRNWESNTLYGSLAITTGRAVGRVGDGLAQVYLKPNVLIGADRPADWSIEVGFRVIGF